MTFELGLKAWVGFHWRKLERASEAKEMVCRVSQRRLRAYVIFVSHGAYLRGEKDQLYSSVTYQRVPGSVLSSLLYITFEVSKQSDEPFTSPLPGGSRSSAEILSHKTYKAAPNPSLDLKSMLCTTKGDVDSRKH